MKFRSFLLIGIILFFIDVMPLCGPMPTDEGEIYVHVYKTDEEGKVVDSYFECNLGKLESVNKDIIWDVFCKKVTNYEGCEIIGCKLEEDGDMISPFPEVLNAEDLVAIPYWCGIRNAYHLYVYVKCNEKVGE